MQRGRGREDVLKVFGARFLESVEWRTREVCLEGDQESRLTAKETFICCTVSSVFPPAVTFSEQLVVQSLSGQSHGLVFGQGDPHHFAKHLLAVQVAHSCESVDTHEKK